MSPPQLGAEEGSRGNVSAIPGSPMMDCSSRNNCLKERNYLGLSDCSSADCSSVSGMLEGKDKGNLNLRATELRLGLPGSQSPERDTAKHGQLNRLKFEEIPLFPLLPSKDGVCVSMQKTVVLGNKRGFSDTLNRVSEMKGSMRPAMNSTVQQEDPSKGMQERSHSSNGTGHKEMNASNNSRNAPAAKYV